MSSAPTKFVKRCAQWIPKKDSALLPPGTRGIYALLQERPNNKFDVVYIGMTSCSSVGRRLARHKNDKGKSWSHFSVFEVNDNVSEREIKELEGLFREVYRKDTKFNQLGGYDRLKKVRNNDLKSWRLSD